MSSVNKVILVGRLGADPETRYTTDGKAVTNANIATSERWLDKASGEKKESTEWHRVVFFDQLAEIAGQYLKKGSLCYVEGALRTRKWKDKDGNDRWTTEIRAMTMRMLSSKSADEAGDEGGGGVKAKPKQPEQKELPTGDEAPKSKRPEDIEDDIPF